MVPLCVQVDRYKKRRGAQPSGNAILPDRGRQTCGNLACAPTTRLRMDRCRCARALDESAANQIRNANSLVRRAGVAGLVRRRRRSTWRLWQDQKSDRAEEIERGIESTHREAVSQGCVDVEDARQRVASTLFHLKSSPQFPNPAIS